jgi:deoxyadenosine/deoxycytidine kinase
MIISIDGALGVGKTTVLQELEKCGFDVVYEDLESWKEYLDKFYEDKFRYALPLQIKIALSHKKNIEMCDENKIYFIERGPLSVNHVFGNLLVKDNVLNELEYKLIDEILNDVYNKIDYHIILNIPFNETISRIKQRNTFGEINNIEYLYQVYNEYTKLNGIILNVENDKPIDIVFKILKNIDMKD